MKDVFSSLADEYVKYRPDYPAEFFTYLNTLVQYKETAWDCGTGNGQIAQWLAKFYNKVFASDISQSQINNAKKAENIFYSAQPAENTNFEDCMFDLIVVAQAIHWFDFDRFYSEVSRTAKKNGLLCVVGYSRVQISEHIDKVITAFYQNIIGKYWDKERKYIDDNYQTILFPFHEIQTPKFVNVQYWDLKHLIGHLNTWSAVKHFIKQNGYNPVVQLQNEIGLLWGNEKIKSIRFPLLLRIGQIHS